MTQTFFKRSTVVIVSSILATFLTLTFIFKPRHFTQLTDLISKATRNCGITMTSATPTTWSSPLSGFLERADPYRRSTSEFQPPRSALELVVLHNTPVEPEGFTLAVFSSDSTQADELDAKKYAVDKHGVIHVLQPQDIETLQTLVTSVLTLPPTQEFRNTWVLKHERTSQPIERILVPKSTLPTPPEGRYDQEYSETSVQGFDYQQRELKRPVEGVQTLPQGLWELTGAVLEARQEEQGGGDDDTVLAYVRNLLGNVF